MKVVSTFLMSGKRIIFIIAPFILFILIGLLFDQTFRVMIKGVWLKEDIEKKNIVDTIKLYNKALIDFYASDGVKASLAVIPASTWLRHLIFRDIGYLRLSEKVLVYDMADITPLSIDISNNRIEAIAVIYEEWNYVYQRRHDRKIISPIKGMEQGFKYYLRLTNNGWIITNVHPVDVERPDKGNVLYF